MPHFHRTFYTTITGRRMRATWLQIGDMILFHRERPQ